MMKQVIILVMLLVISFAAY
ncbi:MULTISPECIES: type I toxin-antitoxin system Ibs family toxin [Citrobacter]|uniref:Type I toxin-antitoxin system Ibs family toxin n=1 Tax=Citrobacter portucalensis TaxID=1639133 RepID=A0A5B0SZD3_9ENTR|nr:MULTISPECIES: type I toxin-antitoxin system Ibs family toxin [Citrobacter]KAA1142573.1 type I toxin-antitoxin system Ibs family toxin [Citrobacter portucalensis]QRQ76409.1 type I toxin-antitoxin system Ibs family toxin [Citrobacter sp. B72]